MKKIKKLLKSSSLESSGNNESKNEIDISILFSDIFLDYVNNNREKMNVDRVEYVRAYDYLNTVYEKLLSNVSDVLALTLVQKPGIKICFFSGKTGADFLKLLCTEKSGEQQLYSFSYDGHITDIKRYLAESKAGNGDGSPQKQ